MLLMQEQTSLALANLASATISDRTAVSALSDTNSTLTAALAAATAHLDQATNKITQLEVRLAAILPGNSAPATAPTTQHKPKWYYFNNNYCWTHSYHLKDS